ncbi:MAG: hypothetical protein WAL87_03185 [Chthoniobacterales bacterium]
MNHDLRDTLKAKAKASTEERHRKLKKAKASSAEPPETLTVLPPEPAGTGRKRDTIESLTNFVQMASARLEHEIAVMPLRDLSVSMGIAVDKLETLHGRAQRLSLTIKPEGPTIEDYYRLIGETVETLPEVEDTATLRAEVESLRRQLAEAKGLPALSSGEPEQV